MHIHSFFTSCMIRIIYCTALAACLFMSSCKSLSHVTHRAPKDVNIGMIAETIQGVYEFTPSEYASNASVLVLSPIIQGSSEDNSNILCLDAVLIERGQFFDESSVEQWTRLIIRDKSIHYSDGTIWGVFLSDDYSRLWVRDHSTDSNNVITYESYYMKIK